MPNIPGKKDFKTRPRVIVLSLVSAVVVAGLIFGAYGWFLGRQKRVLDGFARPSFPFSDYSVEELGQMFPQYANENVLTTRTPEETHRMFVEKLKAGDLNGAVECCFRTGDWDEMKNLFSRVEKRGQLDMMVGDLNEIKKEMMLDTMASYSYLGTLNGRKVSNMMEFVKNNQGVWLIKSL